MSQTRNSRVTIKLEPAGKSKLFRDIQEITVNKNDTWYQVLNNRLECMVPWNSGVFITCKRYNIRRPTRGQGWKAKLSEKVGKSLEKFKKKCPLHVVRVWNQNHINPTAQANAGPSNDTRTNNQEQNDNNSSRRVNNSDVNAVTNTTRPSNPGPSHLGLNNAEDDALYYINSVETTYDEQQEELERDGIRPENIETYVLDKLKEYPNDNLLRIKKELQDFWSANKERWRRYENRLPRTVPFLKEIFGVQT